MLIVVHGVHKTHPKIVSDKVKPLMATALSDGSGPLGRTIFPVGLTLQVIIIITFIYIAPIESKLQGAVK